MIIDAIISFIVSIANWFLTLMPNLKLDFTAESMDAFHSVIAGVGCIMPVGTLGIIIGLMAIAYTVEFAWYVLNWWIAKIPFIE